MAKVELRARPEIQVGAKVAPITWTAELLADLPLEERPAPFTEMEHMFGSLEEARQWLGNPEIRDADLHDRT